MYPTTQNILESISTSTEQTWQQILPKFDFSLLLLITSLKALALISIQHNGFELSVMMGTEFVQVVGQNKFLLDMQG